MLEIPPLPAWDSLHPLVVHLPIGLLLVAPLFILLGALFPAVRGRSFLVTGFLLMLLGTASTYVAVETGKAAGQLVERTPEISQVLLRHEELAETTRLVFSALTLIFAAILALPWIFPRRSTPVFATALPLFFLALYFLGSLILVNTGHNGGRLVHEYGVRSIVEPAPNAGAPGS